MSTSIKKKPVQKNPVSGVTDLGFILQLIKSDKKRNVDSHLNKSGPLPRTSEPRLRNY